MKILSKFKLGSIAFLVFNANLALADIAGVDEILITSTNNDWLQVAQVIAIDQATNYDVAASFYGATATSSGSYDPSSSTPDKAINGDLSPRQYAYDPTTMDPIYHSSSPNGAWLEVTLANPTDLASLTIAGRTDYSFRDVYNIQLLDSSNVVLFSQNDLNANSDTHLVTVNFTSAVPVPAAVWLFGSALAGLIGFNRRKLA
jgi:hypothetical protein